MAKSKKQENELEKIEAFFSTESEHRNSFFFNIYKDAKKEQIFESPLIPLQNIDRLITACYTGRARPVQTAKGVIKDCALFSREQQCFVYDWLIKFLEQTVWTDKEGRKIELNKIKEPLDFEFMSLRPKNWQPPEKKFDFEKTKKHLETIIDKKSKIKYLIEAKTDFTQANGTPILGYGENSFADLCELEIKKLRAISDLDKLPDSPNKVESKEIKDGFSLSNAASKIDYIRIVNALWELRCFQKEDGTIPTKKDVMKAFGSLVNIDLSNYTNDMNKAFNSNVTIEQNLEIFEKLKRKIQELYLNNQNKHKK